MKIRIGFSTCPNDTFIFDALINGKIASEGLEFEPYLSDVEDLNLMAFRGEMDVSKLSYHAWLHVWKEYVILDAGSALGHGNGPLLVARDRSLDPQYLSLRIAIPGEYTTANLLLRLAYPHILEKKVFVFSDIEQAILEQQVDAGVLIHENRFTYQRKGLVLLRDLGEFWEHYSHTAIPLGGIMAHRRLPEPVMKSINHLIRKSLQVALDNPDGALPYMRRYAQEMEPDVLEAHVKAFVTENTLELGEEGRLAILKLIEKSLEAGLIQEEPADIFI